MKEYELVTNDFAKRARRSVNTVITQQKTNKLVPTMIDTCWRCGKKLGRLVDFDAMEVCDECLKEIEYEINR